MNETIADKIRIETAAWNGRGGFVVLGRSDVVAPFGLGWMGERFHRIEWSHVTGEYQEQSFRGNTTLDHDLSNLSVGFYDLMPHMLNKDWQLVNYIGELAALGRSQGDGEVISACEVPLFEESPRRLEAERYGGLTVVGEKERSFKKSHPTGVIVTSDPLFLQAEALRLGADGICAYGKHEPGYHSGIPFKLNKD